MKEKEFRTNRFMSLANEYSMYGTSDDEIAMIDVTEEFWKEIGIEIRDEELVNIQINAKVRLGKSTIAIHIGQKIFELLLKNGKRDSGKFGITNIARDQQEYSKKMRDGNTRNTVIVTDEMNELEETGANVSVEKALNNVFSNIQAIRYVHRVSCSPRGTIDPNADIFIEIMSVDREKKLTHAYLYYNLFKKGFSQKQLIGHVTFNVGDLIKEWDKISKSFLKVERTKEEEEEIEKARKKDFYVEYMIKKCEKNELITKENILRPRILEYAEVILGVEKNLRELAKANVLTKDTIKNYIKMACRQKGIPTSIIGDELMTNEVVGILSLWKSLHKIEMTIEKEKTKSKVTRGTIEKAEAMSRMAIELKNAIHSQLEELRRYKEINEEYQNVESE